MSGGPHKRRRLYDTPAEWSTLRQTWNASSLAENVTELDAQVGTLEEALRESQAREDALVELQQAGCAALAELQEAHRALQDARTREHASHVESRNALRQTLKAAAAAHKADMDTLKSDNAELRRQVHEHQGRAKTWRARYEKLVDRGAAALASKTVAEYGVTPDQVSLYKDFAAKQAEAARAAEAARQAALQATQLALENK